MADQHPYQPQALVGNQFSDAYFAALRQRANPTATKCAHCGASLLNRSRLSDGAMVWCDAGHRELWIKKQAEGTMFRSMVEHGWSKERWAAANK
jgi:hypothetical protein